MRSRIPRNVFATLFAVSLAVFGTSAQADDAKEAELAAKADEARGQFIENAPALEEFFDNSHAYALYPRIKKGAIGIGGAHGKGFVYRGGERIARTSVSQGTIGFQLGGQVYSEVIFFEDTEAFKDFTEGNFEISAQASAIAAAEGAARNANYSHGVAIFTLGQGGAMFEASIGGQKFSYDPL